MTITAIRPDALDILVERVKRTMTEYELYEEIEKEARYRTWLAYRRRNVGRLFPIGPHVGHDPYQWDAMRRMWFGKAIGCVAVLDGQMSNDTFEEAVIAGVFLGVNNGYFGSAVFEVGKFSGPGVTTCRSPLNVGFVHELGGPFQKLIDAVYFTEDDEDDYDADD